MIATQNPVIMDLNIMPTQLELIKLPETLTYLDLQLRHANRRVLKEEIESLPKSLKSLYLGPLDSLEHAEHFSNILPYCHLYYGKIDFWNSSNGLYLQNKFGPSVSPPPAPFDLAALIAAIDNYYSSRNTHFELLNHSKKLDMNNYFKRATEAVFKPLQATDTVTADPKLFWKLVENSTAIETLLVRGFPSIDLRLNYYYITRLDLGPCKFEGDLSNLPNSLTHLTSTSASEHSFTRALPLNFQVLDIPKWRIPLRAMEKYNFSSCRTLNVIIHSAVDLEIVELLKRVPPLTRSDMAVSVCFVASGKAFPELNPPATIDYGVLIASLEQMAKHELDAPLVSDTSDHLLSDLKVGTGVASTSFDLNLSHQRDLSVTIPFTASSARYDLPLGWKLGKFVRFQHPRLNGSEKESSVLQEPERVLHPISRYFIAPCSLTKLELLNVRVFGRWIHCLPMKLRFLRIQTCDCISDFNPRSLSSHLESLVIECNSSAVTLTGRSAPTYTWNIPSRMFLHSEKLPYYNTGNRLTINLSSLPKKLKHLVLTDVLPYSLSQADCEAATEGRKSRLPRLRTVILGDMKGWSNELMRLLPLQQLDRFEHITRHLMPLAPTTSFIYPAGDGEPEKEVFLSHKLKLDADYSLFGFAPSH